MLVGRKPCQRPRELLVDQRLRRRNQEVVLVKRQAEVLALATTLDASTIQLGREAKPLGDVYGLVESGQPGVPQPGVCPGKPERDQKTAGVCMSPSSPLANTGCQGCRAQSRGATTGGAI